MEKIIQDAIDKIDNEAEDIGTDYAKIIASHIIETHLVNEENAKKVIDEKRTLSDCLSQIKSKARPQSKNGCAAIQDEVVFEWVKDYYEFKDSCSSSSKIVDIMDFL